jgi:hypothetical protein
MFIIVIIIAIKIASSVKDLSAIAVNHLKGK